MNPPTKPECRVLINSPHPAHGNGSRRDWIDMALRWQIRIEQYSNPLWTPTEIMRLVYETWPFKIEHNPKFIIAKMTKSLITSKTHGKDGTNPLYAALLGHEGRNELNAIIAYLKNTVDDKHWEPPEECKWTTKKSDFVVETSYLK